jgi:UDP-glucuronate 4-epimerase
MHILVTGSAGAIGAPLVQRLQTEGHTVQEFDLLYGQDICKLEHLCSALQGIDGIIHLAAVADLNLYHENPVAAQYINVSGTRNVLVAARMSSAWVMFASTCCVYGNNNCHPSDETSPLAPTEPYAQSKANMEYEVLDSSTRNIVMRLATCYGPTMRPAISVALFLDAIRTQQPVYIHGNGLQTRTMTFIDDIVQGIVILVRDIDQLQHRVYNITTEESVTVMDMVRTIEQVVGKRAHIVHVPDRPFQIYDEKILSRRLQELGWHAEYSLERGISCCYQSILRSS